MLDEIRVERACRLLAASSKPLSEIAKLLGYTNASSFSRAFARLMAIKPVVYRRQRRGSKHDRRPLARDFNVR